MKVTPYLFKQTTVRVYTDGETNKFYFLGRDIADLLGYRDAEPMTRKLGGEGFILRNIHGICNREVVLLDEYGLNLSVFGAKMEKARAVRRWVQDELLPRVKEQHTLANRLASIGGIRPKVGSSSAGSTSVEEFSEHTRGRFFTVEQFAAAIGLSGARVIDLRNQVAIAYLALERSGGPYPPSANVDGKVLYEVEFLPVLRAALAFSPRKPAGGYGRAIDHLIRRGRLGVADAVTSSELKDFLTDDLSSVGGEQV